MEFEITRECEKFANKELNKATNEILKIGTRIKQDMYKVALVLERVHTTKCYEEDGFKNVSDYAKQVFGFAKSNTYALIKIAENYTDLNTKESNLPHEEGKDFTTSQIQKMLPAKYEEVVNLVNEGGITPEMSCRDIEKVIKSLNRGEGEGEGEGESETSTDEVIESNNTIIELSINENGNRIILINGVVRDLETAINELTEWVR